MRSSLFTLEVYRTINTIIRVCFVYMKLKEKKNICLHRRNDREEKIEVKENESILEKKKKKRFNLAAP